jgi:hypothetical protein
MILAILMSIAFCGMLVCVKKQHSSSKAKLFALFFSAVMIICGIIILVKYLGPPDTEKYINDKVLFVKSSGYKLGRFFADKMPGKKVIILKDPTRNDSKFQEALLDGLNEGLSPDITNIVIASPLLHHPRPETEKNKPITNLFKAKEFNRILKKYPRCNIIISLIGLPKDSENMDLSHKFLKKKSSKIPAIALLNCRVPKMYQLMKAGFISVVVYPNPAKKYSENRPSSDLNDTFDMRYLLITPKNMDEIAKQFPGRVFKRSSASQKK